MQGRQGTHEIFNLLSWTVTEKKASGTSVYNKQLLHITLHLTIQHTHCCCCIEMSLLVTSPNPSVGPDHLVQRTGHSLIHNVIYRQESKTSNSRMRRCLKYEMPTKEGCANLFFYSFISSPCNCGGDILAQILKKSLWHLSAFVPKWCGHIHMSKFFSSQAIIQILWFAAGTFRGHILLQSYYKPMKPSEIYNKINKFQEKLITTSFGSLRRGQGGGNDTAEFVELFSIA